MEFFNHPYKVFIKQIIKETEISKCFLSKNKIVYFNLSLSKIIAICEIILELKKDQCFNEEYFKRMRSIISWKLQEVIDVCPTEGNKSQEIYTKIQTLYNKWIEESNSENTKVI